MTRAIAALYLTHANNFYAFPFIPVPSPAPFIFLIPFPRHRLIWKISRGTPNVCVALNGLFADMRMSSSMYEVFNWNSSPDPPLTPAKHKRASLSLPPTTDIFAVDDKSDSDTRRPMIQRAASGESWCFRTSTKVSGEIRSCLKRMDIHIYFINTTVDLFVFSLAPSFSFFSLFRRILSLFFSLVLRHYYVFLFNITTLYTLPTACHIHLTPQEKITSLSAHFLSLVPASFPADCTVLVRWVLRFLGGRPSRPHRVTSRGQYHATVCAIGLWYRFLAELRY